MGVFDLPQRVEGALKNNGKVRLQHRGNWGGVGGAGVGLYRVRRQSKGRAHRKVPDGRGLPEYRVRTE